MRQLIPGTVTTLIVGPPDHVKGMLMDAYRQDRLVAVTKPRPVDGGKVTVRACLRDPVPAWRSRGPRLAVAIVSAVTVLAGSLMLLHVLLANLPTIIGGAVTIGVALLILRGASRD